MLRALLYLLIYAALAFGALQLGRLELGHSICGPWGCGPPSSALLAIHTFWLVTILISSFALRGSVSGISWRRVGIAMAITGFTAAIVIGVWDFFTWRPHPFQLEGMYLGQRFLFRLATLPDLPVIQLGLAGLALVALPWSRARAQRGDAGQAF